MSHERVRPWQWSPQRQAERRNVCKTQTSVFWQKVRKFFFLHHFLLVGDVLFQSRRLLNGLLPLCVVLIWLIVWPLLTGSLWMLLPSQGKSAPVPWRETKLRNTSAPVTVTSLQTALQCSWVSEWVSYHIDNVLCVYLVVYIFGKQNIFGQTICTLRLFLLEIVIYSSSMRVS